MSETKPYEPKCRDLMEAIAEVRFQYSKTSLFKLMNACLEFTKEVDA